MQEENEDAEVDLHEKMKQAIQEQKGAVEANEVLMSYFCQGELDPMWKRVLISCTIECVIKKE